MRKIMVDLDAVDVAKAREVVGARADEPDAVIVQRVLNGYLLNAPGSMCRLAVESLRGGREPHCGRGGRAYRREGDAS